MENDKVKLRRFQDDLNVGGLGVVILGAWDVLKIIMHVIMEAKDNIDLEQFTDGDKTIAVFFVAAIILGVLLIAFIIFMIHMYIGLNASKAAKGEPYKKGYDTGAIILLILSFLGMFAYIDELKDVNNIDTTIASFIVDLTTVYILWIVVSRTKKISELRSLHTQE